MSIIFRMIFSPWVSSSLRCWIPAHQCVRLKTSGRGFSLKRWGRLVCGTFSREWFPLHQMNAQTQMTLSSSWRQSFKISSKIFSKASICLLCSNWNKYSSSKVFGMVAILCNNIIACCRWFVVKRRENEKISKLK